MRIAYLINCYPATSHSFIRREIEAVEHAGFPVTRFSVRPADTSSLPDGRDRAEIDKTEVLLGMGVARLAAAALQTVARSPRNSFAGIRIALSSMDWTIMGIVRRMAYFAEAAALAKLMRSKQIDHLHAHFGTNPAMVARIASKLSSIPYSFTVHGPDEFDAPRGLDLRGKIADSAFCVAISSFGRSQLMRWSAYTDWHKIEVVRCGVDANFLATRELPSVPDEPNFCAVARLGAQKGVPLLIEAAGRLKRAGKKFHLSIVGDGEMRPEIEAMIQRLNLDGVVELVGWASSDVVIERLLAARALVLPSFAEGLPVVIMEALALGRPVIVTAIAGTPELVDAQCGWLISAGSIDALVKAMESAIEAPVERLAEMGAVGRDRVAQQHDAGVNGRQLAHLFQSLREQRK